jgi:hypothetical protein
MHAVGVSVGMAYSRAAATLIDELSDDLDYAEYPYELLVSDAAIAERACRDSAILHCASMSLASGDAPTVALLSSVADLAGRMSSPWIGEHLAFVAARLPDGASPGDGLRYDIGFAVSPAMNPQTVDNVVSAVTDAGSVLEQPLVIENSPIYLSMPGSTMSQGQVLTEICQQTGAGVLLDLAHLLITCDTLALDAMEALRRFPLERVVEVHLSGVTRRSGVLWDDHAVLPADAEYDLLGAVLDEAPVKAVTHEYNWAPRLSAGAVRRQIDRTRDLVGCTA